LSIHEDRRRKTGDRRKKTKTFVHSWLKKKKQESGTRNQDLKSRMAVNRRKEFIRAFVAKKEETRARNQESRLKKSAGSKQKKKIIRGLKKLEEMNIYSFFFLRVNSKVSTISPYLSINISNGNSVGEAEYPRFSS